ncbi:MAG: ComEC/Rec2 family competence protein [Clostridium sp.]|uniref:ComEC/Rec2 family competence protein n=1 Tax=Clostridium sp. TaxID=1506 RepID=UPI002912A820|nr:ComEC/Rec2 family competence protein [Clostridium sp.]MDU5111535.1 ComEC/Rec2 family competence protein [Clostridium sp.]
MYIKKRHIKNFQFSLIAILIIANFILIKNITNSNNIINPNEITVNFIDVGQGDSILIQVNNKVMLIDSGAKSEKERLVEYLDTLNLQTIDYVIATHPHEDHIGNMAYIINKYKIKEFYAPKASSNTSAFENMIESLSRKNLKINILKADINSINLGNNTKVEVLTPNLTHYENLNNYSPIIKVTYGEVSFLFTGDAEGALEEEVINKSYNLKSDILKVSHHGSSTSTSKEFLNKVDPNIAIISVGEDNTYGHPTKETLNILSNIKVYRTDINGTIIISSNGESIDTSFK